MANNDTTGTIKEGISEVVGHDNVAGMKHRFIEAKSVVTDKAGSMVKMVTETIKAHPLIAVGFALAIGYVVIRLIRRD